MLCSLLPTTIDIGDCRNSRRSDFSFDTGSVGRPSLFITHQGYFTHDFTRSYQFSGTILLCSSRHSSHKRQIISSNPILSPHPSPTRKYLEEFLLPLATIVTLSPYTRATIHLQLFLLLLDPTKLPLNFSRVLFRGICL